MKHGHEKVERLLRDARAGLWVSLIASAVLIAVWLRLLSLDARVAAVEDDCGDDAPDVIGNDDDDTGHAEESGAGVWW